MSNLELYNKVRVVPIEAQKQIGGGRLKGMTDINPMWRIKTLTEMFGACGDGWFYVITDKRVVDGANGEKVATVDIELRVKHANSVDWSTPIVGTGGSMLVSSEKAGLYTNDEAFKMALTDAISVACKALGVGADIYWSKDRTKYDEHVEQPAEIKAKVEQAQKADTAMGDVCKCASCGVGITDKVNDYSIKKFGKPLCYDCQKKPPGQAKFGEEIEDEEDLPF